jgi:non-ribosomal peptide synthetase component F
LFLSLTTDTREQQHTSLRLLAKRGASSLTLFLEWSTAHLGMPPSQGALVASTLAAILSRILGSVRELLPIPSSAAADLDSSLTLGSLDCLSQANLDQVCAWNTEYEIRPVERCVHDVIGDRVRETPDKEAVCAWDGRLTYRELDHVAGRLARRLVQLGVGPEVLVPLCFEKSVSTSTFYQCRYRVC